MTDKSSASSQVISLPKGGGALHGIGETFSPDLHTGTGNFTVPIALPPGRNDFQPQLNLIYSTGNGNGPFGLGWILSVPHVSRKTSKGVPHYDDAKDVFVLSGAEDLVPVRQAGARLTYRPRTEGLFARIEHQHDASEDYWQVRSKDGLVGLYGTPLPHDAPPGWQDPAALAAPANLGRIFSWKLSETRDVFGNRILYEYERDSQATTDHNWNQVYLKRIRYADYTVANNQTQFLISVTFQYADRPDAFSDYRAGFEIRTRRRCKRLEIHTHADKDRLVRTYGFVYLDERKDLANLSQLLPLNRVSLLSEIEVTGYDDEGNTEKLPPLEFGYTRFETERRDFFPAIGADLPAKSLASPDLELADLFGNGLPDILEMQGTVRYWRNLGNGRFDLPRPMRDAPAGLALADPDVQLLDADGDGRTDLMVTQSSLSGYFPLQFNGEWDRRSFRRYKQAPTFSLADPEVKLVDLDGDGVTDAIRSGTRLELFFNNPYEGWNNTRQVERQTLEHFPNINFSDPRLRWSDMTGDGLQDIALIYDGNVEYWPSLGYGNWGRRIHMHNSPRFPYGYDPKRVLVGDVDGDGLADLVYVDDRKLLLWINQSGNAWSEPIEIHGTPPVTDMDAVRLVDLLGTGVSGVLWSRDANGAARQPMFFHDFTGGLKPYLLDEINNHFGAITRVQYAPSTRFYLEDQKDRKTAWQTALPIPVQVVARVDVIDELSKGKLTTEYRPHHGYWDGAEREFRGFGMVEQLHTEAFDNYHAAGLHGDEADFAKVEAIHFSPPTLTKIWFHQGPIGEEFGDWAEIDYRSEYWPGDPPLLERPAEMEDFLKHLPRRVKRDALRALRGSILRTELYALDGTARQDRPYTVTESCFAVCEVIQKGDTHELSFQPQPSDSPEVWDDTLPHRIFFPHLLAQRTTQWERGDKPMTRFSFTDDYDNYGQARQQTQIACPRPWRKLADKPIDIATADHERTFLATRNVMVYAQRDDAHVYIVDRVAKTTSYEIENDGSQRVLELRDLPDTNPSLKIIGQILNYYDGDAFNGLDFGELGVYGALVRSENLVLTEAILHETYKSGDSVLSPPEIPPYLMPGSTPAWAAEYPQPFREELPVLAGYVFYPGDAERERGYFVTTLRRKYDVQPAGKGRGLPVVTRDPLGRETTISYDLYDLLPIKVTDPAGLVTQADYDYRVLQPEKIIDPNGNWQRFGFTALGLLGWSAVIDKLGKGDTEQKPGMRLEYDFLAFGNSPPEGRQPISVRSIRRVHHANEEDVPSGEEDEAIQTIEYSDGFGRLLQTRTQAEDVTFGDSIFGSAVLPAAQADFEGTKSDVIGKKRSLSDLTNVVVSGWQTYNNKGWVVEKYEPFFGTGWDYLSRDEAAELNDQGVNLFGQKATMFFDPRGQVIRTVNPDGSEERVIYGIPTDLSDPEEFAPTPWEAYTYDANDNAESIAYQHHWNTPASMVVDALGRTVKAAERTREPGQPLSAIEEYVTLSAYDIRGNLLKVTDALGRLVFRHTYDLANKPLRIESNDAGLRRVVLDATGKEIERRDSKGALGLQSYDVLNRPIRLWARDGAGQPLTLRDEVIYGDSAEAVISASDAADRNLRGKVFQHYDEAGRLSFDSYDFKGNPLEKVRHVIGDAQIVSVFGGAAANNWQIVPFRTDWQPPNGIELDEHAATLLNPFEYRTSSAYDALNRLKALRCPKDVEGQRQMLRPKYNRAGALEQMSLNGDLYVEQIAYNAKGQRTLIAYGNGIMTRYAYEPTTFRLVRLRTERYTKPTPETYHLQGVALQDFAYEYDLAGNMTALRDRTPGSGIPNTPPGLDALDRSFTYDPLYRLRSATGREHVTLPPELPWDDTLKSQDATLTGAYTEQYWYDPAGNLEKLQHSSNGDSFTRMLATVPGNNRLDTVTIGQTAYDYIYDANGNLIREATSRHFEWDHADRMKVYRTQAGNSEPSVHVHYLYDSDGQRLKKLIRKQGGQYESTIYIEGVFEHQRWQQNGEVKENNRLHVMDEQQRIALVRVGPKHPDDGEKVQYHFSDHLRSSNLVADGTGTWTNREEYTPYGETSFGSFARKRYRFTGKERDEESGLYYHGARYYAPWLGRWASADPLSLAQPRRADLRNSYAYVRGQVTKVGDPLGLEESENSSFEPTVAYPNGTVGAGYPGSGPTGLDPRTKPPIPAEPKSEPAPTPVTPPPQNTQTDINQPGAVTWQQRVAKDAIAGCYTILGTIASVGGYVVSRILGKTDKEAVQNASISAGAVAQVAVPTEGMLGSVAPAGAQRETSFKGSQPEGWQWGEPTYVIPRYKLGAPSQITRVINPDNGQPEWIWSEPTTLQEQLLMEYAMTDPSFGQEPIMPRPLKPRPFNDARFQDPGWAKWSVQTRTSYGAKLEIHYMRNADTGETAQFKFKLQGTHE
jgi:RHS repeat-associated protein